MLELETEFLRDHNNCKKFRHYFSDFKIKMALKNFELFPPILFNSELSFVKTLDYTHTNNCTNFCPSRYTLIEINRAGTSQLETIPILFETKRFFPGR